MNIIEIFGHLGADPETRFTPNGQKVTNLRMATNAKKGGQEETIWWRVTLWGDTFDRILPHIKKGSSLIVVGELLPARIYNDRNGQPAVSFEVRGEIVRFNPFPRQGGNEGLQGGAVTGSQAFHSGGQHHSQGGFNEEDEEEESRGYGGGAKGGAYSGGKQRQEQDTHDDVPF